MYSEEFADKKLAKQFVLTALGLLLGLLVGFFFVIDSAKAYEVQVDEQLIYSTQGNINAIGASGIFPFVPRQSGKLKTMGVMMSAPTQGNTANSISFGVHTYNGSCDPATGTLYTSDNVSVNVENGDAVPILVHHSWATSTAPTLIAGNTYCYESSMSGGGTTGYRYYGTNSVLANEWITAYSGLGFTVNSPVSPFFYVTVDTNAIPNYVQFLPAPTSTCDFGGWQTQGFITDATYNALTSGDGSIVVWYGTIPGVYVYQDNLQTLNRGERGVVPKSHDLEAGGWTATVGYCDTLTPDTDCTTPNSAHVFASSTIYTFTVNQCDNQVGIQGSNIPIATSTNAGDNFTCDPNSGFFTNSLCNLLSFLFVPSATSMNKMQEVKDLIINKPPLGYFTVYQNAIAGLESSTSTTSTITGGDISLMFGLVTTLAIWTTIQNILIIFLWFGFLFYIYERFKNFQL